MNHPDLIFCPTCAGARKVRNAWCQHCRGTGKINAAFAARPLPIEPIQVVETAAEVRRHRIVSNQLPRPYNTSIWDQPRLERLQQLLTQGLSASEIGREMNCTRSAVIGAVGRYGLKLAREQGFRDINAVRKRQSTTRTRPAGVVKTTELRRAKGNASAAPVTLVEPLTLQHFDSIIPLNQRVVLVALESHHCRWPVGTPGTSEFFFCGGTRGARSYCSFHHDASVDAARTRRVSGAGVYVPGGRK